MKSANKMAKKTMSYLLAITMLMSMIISLPFSANATVENGLEYAFSGANASESGYAEGKITLTSAVDGDYYLYWADDTKALDGYYEIAKLTISDGNSASFDFGYHTAIPAGATKVIAVADKADLSVANAMATYAIPNSKQLNTGSGDLLYTFNSYSDVHIDTQGYYKNAEKNWAQALKFGVDKGTDFIVSSGDMVTNASGPEDEWLVYEKVLAKSDYVNPVWESDGNHDMRSGVATGLASFVRASGTDNTIANYDANKPYYYITEQSTGDIFIFMALENDSNPSSCDEFSDEQINWLVKLIDENYGKGVNIYIIEHSPIKGFGAGDRMEKPYYKAHLSENFISTVKFKRILQKYPKLIWMSGHTHEDYSMGYNYSNENGTACHMIHNAAVAGSTWAAPTATSLDYNNGIGYNSQGYYVEAYENQVVYYGANLTDELIYPAYCYIMDGSRTTTPDATNPTEEATIKPTEEMTGETGSTLPSGIDTKRVYFANTLKWQYIDCYSWATADTTTCSWPGYAAKYYGTTEQGVDLYYCDIPATHENIIWNNAGNSYQTVDIVLDGVNDFFTPSVTVSSKKVPVTASVWDYNPVTEPTETVEPTTPTESTQPTESTVATEPTEATTPVQKSDYVLCYYSSGTHGWKDLDTYFAEQSDGTYALDFTATNSENISCNVFDSKASTYNCVATSTSLTFATGETTKFDLVASNARGKSLTIKGLAEGSKIKFVYNPTDNTLTVICGEENIPSTPATEPTEATTVTVPTSPVEYQIGDADMDGRISVYDVTLIQLYLAGETDLTNEQLELADVDFDGVITINDATTIQFYLVGAITEFKKNENVPQNARISVASVSEGSENKWTATSLKEALAQVKSELATNYTFSSYDQYQNLKKYYYAYRNADFVENESEVVAEFERLSKELNIMAEHIGAPKIYTIGDVYYFENTNNWKTVNCYAWSGSSNNAEWPGGAMQKVGTNNGHDVYGIKFEYAAQYANLIFNNGTDQTVDIALNTFEFNAFRINGVSASGKLNVENFSYKSEVEPTVAPTTTKPVTENEHYAVCYYCSGSHNWADIDTYLAPQADGTYTLDFVASSVENISLNIYDKSSGTYNCVPASTSLTFAPDATTTYELVASSSRGKSLTVKDLAVGSIISFVYNPTANTLTISCKGVATTEPIEQPTTQPTTGATDDVVYTLYMAPVQSSVDNCDTYKVNVKDSAGNYHSYNFEKTEMKFNGAVVYKADIKNPTFTDVIKLQFQTRDLSDVFVGQVVDEQSVALSYYNNKIMVCSSAKAGELVAFNAD